MLLYLYFFSSHKLDSYLQIICRSQVILTLSEAAMASSLVFQILHCLETISQWFACKVCKDYHPIITLLFKLMFAMLLQFYANDILLSYTPVGLQCLLKSSHYFIGGKLEISSKKSKVTIFANRHWPPVCNWKINRQNLEQVNFNIWEYFFAIICNRKKTQRRSNT